MLLAICILVNALIGVIFKLFHKYGVQTLPAIVTNYAVCVLTSIVVTGRWTVNSSTLHEPYLLPALGLGVAFIIIFDVIARTVGSFGIVVASVFQKMSLVAPTVVAIVWFGESLTPLKGFGIALAIFSILMITGILQTGVKGEHSLRDWILPIITLVGSSVIDVSLLFVQAKGIANNADIGFVATLFASAGLVGLFLLVYSLLSGKSTYGKKELLGGIALGIPNFFSIYLLLLLLNDGWEGSVIFPINNVGILAVSALVSFLFFSEPPTRARVLGVLLSITAIFMIAYG